MSLEFAVCNPLQSEAAPHLRPGLREVDDRA